MATTKLAKSIVIDKRAGKVLIDGEEFGFHVRPEVEVSASFRRGIPSEVTLTVFADSVEIIPADEVQG